MDGGRLIGGRLKEVGLYLEYKVFLLYNRRNALIRLRVALWSYKFPFLK